MSGTVRLYKHHLTEEYIKAKMLQCQCATMCTIAIAGAASRDSLIMVSDHVSSNMHTWERDDVEWHPHRSQTRTASCLTRTDATHTSTLPTAVRAAPRGMRTPYPPRVDSSLISYRSCCPTSASTRRLRDVLQPSRHSSGHARMTLVRHGSV